MNIKYTNERNIQMLIFLLKENNIKKIIINPGTMNMSFVASIQSDPFFELYSCIDERSACYMACGLATESGEPVVLTCTGATASRNYMPGLTEAFYRKIPILAVTCTPHLANVGQNMPQMLDRSIQLKDTFKLSVYVSPIKCLNDEWNDTILLNKAILELKHNGGGPVHINLGGEITKIFNQNELPKFRKISRVNIYDKVPYIKNNARIGIFVGNHKIWKEELVKQVESFCEKYNAVVICDHTSNYFGKYKILLNLICDQESYKSELNQFDLLIHMGDTSGAYMSINTKEVWRVNSDGEIKDTFKKLTYVYEMEEECFFKLYNEKNTLEKNISFYEKWKAEMCEFEQLLNNSELPFSNPWIARETLKVLPQNGTLHLAILNTLRSWNYMENPKKLKCFCNTGGFGIDGILSTLIGASFNDSSHNYYGIIGDLAFFYDMNSLGNRHIKNNLRIMLINNGCGTEFHNYSHPANVIGDDMLSDYIAANGHFGNKSKTLVKNYVESLGFEYISANTKEEFLEKLEYFANEEIYDKPLVFEIFTDSKEESDALYKIRHLKIDFKENLKHKIKRTLSSNTKNIIKNMWGESKK